MTESAGTWWKELYQRLEEPLVGSANTDAEQPGNRRVLMEKKVKEKHVGSGTSKEGKLRGMTISSALRSFAKKEELEKEEDEDAEASTSESSGLKSTAEKQAGASSLGSLRGSNTSSHSHEDALSIKRSKIRELPSVPSSPPLHHAHTHDNTHDTHQTHPFSFHSHSWISALPGFLMTLSILTLAATMTILATLRNRRNRRRMHMQETIRRKLRQRRRKKKRRLGLLRKTNEISKENKEITKKIEGEEDVGLRLRQCQRHLSMVLEEDSEEEQEELALLPDQVLCDFASSDRGDAVVVKMEEGRALMDDANQPMEVEEEGAFINSANHMSGYTYQPVCKEDPGIWNDLGSCGAFSHPSSHRHLRASAISSGADSLEEQAPQGLGLEVSSTEVHLGPMVSNQDHEKSSPSSRTDGEHFDESSPLLTRNSSRAICTGEDTDATMIGSSEKKDSSFVATAVSVDKTSATAVFTSLDKSEKIASIKEVPNALPVFTEEVSVEEKAIREDQKQNKTSYLPETDKQKTKEMPPNDVTFRQQNEDSKVPNVDDSIMESSKRDEAACSERVSTKNETRSSKRVEPTAGGITSEDDTFEPVRNMSHEEIKHEEESEEAPSVEATARASSTSARGSVFAWLFRRTKKTHPSGGYVALPSSTSVAVEAVKQEHAQDSVEKNEEYEGETAHMKTSSEDCTMHEDKGGFSSSLNSTDASSDVPEGNTSAVTDNENDVGEGSDEGPASCCSSSAWPLSLFRGGSNSVTEEEQREVLREKLLLEETTKKQEEEDVVTVASAMDSTKEIIKEDAEPNLDFDGDCSVPAVATTFTSQSPLDEAPTRTVTPVNDIGERDLTTPSDDEETDSSDESSPATFSIVPKSFSSQFERRLTSPHSPVVVPGISRHGLTSRANRKTRANKKQVNCVYTSVPLSAISGSFHGRKTRQSVYKWSFIIALVGIFLAGIYVVSVEVGSEISCAMTESDSVSRAQNWSEAIHAVEQFDFLGGFSEKHQFGDMLDEL